MKPIKNYKYRVGDRVISLVDRTNVLIKGRSYRVIQSDDTWRGAVVLLSGENNASWLTYTTNICPVAHHHNHPLTDQFMPDSRRQPKITQPELF